MEEGGCDDMAYDGEQVVTISGYEDVAANDEQALVKARRTSPSAPPSRRPGGTSSSTAGYIYVTITNLDPFSRHCNARHALMVVAAAHVVPEPDERVFG